MNNKLKKRKPKKNRSSSWLIVTLTVIALLVCLIGMAAAYLMMYKPDVDVDENPFGTDTDRSETEEPVETEDQANTPAIETDPLYTERVEDKYNILVMGRDKVALNTDVIMVVSYDVKNGNLSILQIPRDTYIGGSRVNALLAQYYNDARAKGADDPLYTDMQSVASSIQTNMNIVIDRFVLVNIDSFRSIVDLIGGVEIDVPIDMEYHDPDQNLHIDLKAGKQTLNGEKAEQFMRYRAGYLEGDIGRVNAQKLFISAFISQLKKSVSPSMITGLVNELINNVTTSLSVSDCVYFGTNALNLDLSKISMMTLPGVEARANVDSGAWYYIMKRYDTLAIINRYLNVFTDEITDSIFDRNRVFTDTAKQHINDIYYAAASVITDNTYTASGILDGDDPDIPLDSRYFP
ncbi:MAG: LCP family protein [Clostridia bacterium]|nr:LCP family protein [Clostridia bacterium]